MTKVKIHYANGVYGMTRCENQDLPANSDNDEYCLPEKVVQDWEKYCDDGLIYQELFRRMDEVLYNRN